MALEFNFNTPIDSNSGTSLTIAYARLNIAIAPDEASILVHISYYESEQAYIDRRMNISVDQIPRQLSSINSTLTPAQYANVDMATIHNQFRDILLNGANAGSYPPTADQTWLGLIDIDALNTVTVVMPV